jgi:hypothetical protein
VEGRDAEDDLAAADAVGVDVVVGKSMWAAAEKM